MRLTLACLVAAALGCGDAGTDQPPPREVVIEAVVGADGLFADVPFEIPGGTRSITIVVEGTTTGSTPARITAHEAGHFLALQHVQNRVISGRSYPDPLDDTTPGADNLMVRRTLLTPNQAFALSRSALLVVP